MADIGERLGRFMRRWDEVPVRSLQYRMTEVGRSRLEPHLVFEVLAKVLNLTAHEAARAVLVADEYGAISQAQDPSLKLTELLAEAATSTMGLDLARHSIELLLDLKGVYRATGQAGGSTGSRVVIGNEFPATWARTTVAGPSGDVDVVMSHDLDWFSARTEFFWHFAKSASERDAALVFVVRKAAPATFLVCRELGVRVVQYYSTLCHEVNAGSVRTLSEQYGWFHTISIESLRQHAFTTLLDRHIEAAVPIDRQTLQEGLGKSRTSPAASNSEWDDGIQLERALLAANERATAARATNRTETSNRRAARSKQRAGKEDGLFGRPTEITRIGVKV